MSDMRQHQARFAAMLDAGSGDRASAIYRNTVALGAIEALGDNHPTVRRLLGKRRFEALALGCARALPPRGPVLATYGAAFADYIEEQDVATELPYLSDVARIDRLFLESLFAADAEPLDPTSLSGLEPERWEGLKLGLHPATRFGWYTSPAMAIWLAHRDTEEVGESSFAWRAGGALFARPFGRVEAWPIGCAAHHLLFGIRLGDTVGTSALATAALYPGTDVGVLFASLAARGLFAPFQTSKGT